MEDVATDANPVSTGASESSALESALSAHDERPQGAAPIAVPSDKAPITPAGALNTGSSEQSQEDQQVPWNKDKRWQKWQADQKQWVSEKQALEEKARQAEMWNSAVANNPEFRSKLLKVIEELTTGGQPEAPQPTQFDPVAEKLLGTGPFKNLFKKIESLEGILNQGSEELRNQKFNATVANYRSQFKDLTKDLQVHPTYQKHFEREVWEELYKLNPEACNKYEYDPVAFEQAVKTVQESYKGMINGVVSDYTKRASTESIPRTQSGGLTPIGTRKSEAEETQDFISQLRALS